MEFLRTVLEPWDCHHPFQVFSELDGFDGNRSALDAKWITFVNLELKYDLLAARFQAALGGVGTKHLGEAQCIALALQENCEVLIDDRDGNDLAYDNDLTAWSTTEMLEYGIRKGDVDPQKAAEYLDGLISNGYKGLDVTSGAMFIREYLPRHLRPRG
ncbi:hypothetical protein [Corynebacterium lujinxingii]|uniref:Uncharacterized protein n=1 Tax=Corynebacterium lujinxingii TaxID=2763010 RepID=A0A7H0JY59_9CORY|nr:hypothetical protein [Corynebacterium lujinxingii]MBC3178328.1 hypothetical protein [Corynebacterium lujinxingii]NNO10795.1 hypothetical protein [Corynebacterium lujinxingii]QNP89975.1 hypothetical protein IAU68_10010 [Corynebacterium lujinxingii]